MTLAHCTHAVFEQLKKDAEQVIWHVQQGSRNIPDDVDSRRYTKRAQANIACSGSSIRQASSNVSA
jgi:hypothetical protein